MLLCTFAFTGWEILEDTTFFFAVMNEGVEYLYHIYISDDQSTTVICQQNLEIWR
jgi:hypothetical protein